MAGKAGFALEGRIPASNHMLVSPSYMHGLLSSVAFAKNLRIGHHGDTDGYVEPIKPADGFHIRRFQQTTVM